MAYVEAHAALREHPKTKKAARLLQIAPRDVIGHLLYLWWWCQDYAQDGNLSACSATEIADAADWERDPDEFVNALLSCGRANEPGFLEIATDGALIVHDWFDYGGKLFKIREQGARRQANWRIRHGNAVVTPGNDEKTQSNALVTRHVTLSNAYRGEEIREEEKTPAPLSASPTAAAGRREAADMKQLNAVLEPKLRVPLANAILDMLGKRALADAPIPTPHSAQVLLEAHECAIEMFGMGYKTPDAVLALSDPWRADWRGKGGGGAFSQFSKFASEQLGNRGNGKAPEPIATEVF